MATAISLQQAAAQAYDNLTIWWLNGQLKTKCTAFANALLAQCPDGNVGSRPVANWGVILAALATNMKISSTFPPFSTHFPETDLSDAAQIVYKACWICSYLSTSPQTAVSSAQATAVLASYNATF